MGTVDGSNMSPNPHFMEGQKRMFDSINALKQDLIKLQNAFNSCQNQVNKIDEEVNTVNQLDPTQKMDRLKIRMIEDVVIDKLTPIKRDFNVDFK
jgi:regulator of replication initiation timing